jgi:predicted PurR-regulated permease PerM
MQKTLLVILVVLVTFGLGVLLWHFFQPLFWATTLAAIFYPLQVFLRSRFHGRKSLAAGLTLTIIVLAVLLPLALLASAVLSELLTYYGRMQAGEVDPAAPIRWLQSMLPSLNNLLSRLGIDLSRVGQDLASGVLSVGRLAAGYALSAGQNVLQFALMFVVMLYVLFFALRDGDQLVEHLAHALPLGDNRERALMKKFAEVARATIKGSVLIGVLQGTLGGLLFVAVGIDGAVFWGVIMIFLSFVPALGSALVWLPTVFIFAAQGAWVRALIVLTFGISVILLLDNLLRPRLVGRETRLPDYLVLLSSLGGVASFGFSGLIIGPVVAALFLAVWSMWIADGEARAHL